ADMLQRLHFPYDIIILGHPDLMDDTYYLDRLKNYDAIIFPDVSDISAIQIEAVENFVKNGGKIIFTGNIPTYDQDHNDLTQEKQSRLNRIILEHTDQVVLIRDLLGCEWYGNMIKGYTEEEKYNSTLNKFKGLLNSMIEKPLVITNNLPESVEVNILKKDDTVSIHFINYQYFLETDEFLKTNNTQILIDATIVGKIDDITFLSPETTEQLKFNYDGRYINITLPPLNYWGFVIINKPETFRSEFEVSDLNVNPDTIKIGQVALISVSVKNNGREIGSYVLTLKVNGLVVDTRTVKLNPGQSTSVSFSYTPEKEGRYSIEVNGLTGSLTVSEEESEGKTPSLVPETILLAMGVVVITMALVGLFFRRKTQRRPP
ncbi:MAG: CARDB domain-containing protein, partial [Thermoproteota archaeon]